jgi:hypothetical protein
MKKMAVFIMVAAGVFFALPLSVILATASGAEGGAPSDAAYAEIPEEYLQLYLSAPSQHCPTLDWAVLAAIGFVESRHGTLKAPGVDSGSNFAGAAGPMQFGIGGMAGNTWGGPGPIRPTAPALLYGVDGNGDRVANVYDPADAIPAAALYLCAHGADNPARIRQAIWAYNHSWDYVDSVLAKAQEYTAATVPMADGLIADVLANPRLKIYEAGREDIARGRIDDRLLTLLMELSAQYELYISSLQTGHSTCVGGGDYAGCDVSNHYYGRAADIAIVNGELVRSHSHVAHELASRLAALSGPLRPEEVGSPWTIASLGYFTDAAHADHIHIGYSGG